MKRVAVAVLLLGLVVGSGCGKTAQEGKIGNGKRGGAVTFLAAGDVDSMDPGQSNYQFAAMVDNAIYRTLYSYKPDSTEQIPDLAAQKPQVSADRKTVTIKLRKGVMFAPPVSREVTSKDFKYAFERAFTANVPNGYAREYYSDLEGMTSKVGAWRSISGIQTPDRHTLVFKLTRPTGTIFTLSLGKLIASPVPREYAQKFDLKSPSTYGQYAVATGPYMIVNDTSGRLVGYEPGRAIRLVRNPNWNPKTDFRPAYLDKITVEEGNSDVTVSARRTIQGSGLLCCDAQPSPAELRDLVTRHRSQLGEVPSRGTRWIALNTKTKPFDNLNVRRAVVAATDRVALRLTRGGAQNGPIAQHFIGEGIPGFKESGGRSGFADLDFLRKPSGDMALATKYMLAARKQGVAINAQGKYTGPPIMAVASAVAPHAQTAEVAQAQFAKLGIQLKVQHVTHDTMYTKFCGVKAAMVPVCPSVGWMGDSADAGPSLQATFDGNAIKDVGSSNWSMLNIPAINKAIDRMAVMPLGEARNQDWAKINHMITAQAPGIPFVWDVSVQLWSKDVNAVMNKNDAMIDLNYTSLK